MKSKESRDKEDRRHEERQKNEDRRHEERWMKEDRRYAERHVIFPEDDIVGRITISR